MMTQARASHVRKGKTITDALMQVWYMGGFLDAAWTGHVQRELLHLLSGQCEAHLAGTVPELLEGACLASSVSMPAHACGETGSPCLFCLRRLHLSGHDFSAPAAVSCADAQPL